MLYNKVTNDDIELKTMPNILIDVLSMECILWGFRGAIDDSLSYHDLFPPDV